jgi:hypothetical protein
MGSRHGRLPIALICSGKSGRAISQILGIGMPTIRQHWGRIHGKIGTHSRLAIGLWAIRNGMVKSAVQSKPGNTKSHHPVNLAVDAQAAS